MVVEAFVENVSEVISVLPPAFVESVGVFLRVLAALGILFILYLAYLITTGVLNWKRFRILRRMERKINEIEKKLDSLIDSKRKKKKK